MIKAPVRLCCGKSHNGAICPDNLVMCCICFTRVPVSELNRTEDGSYEDVCISCAIPLASIPHPPEPPRSLEDQIGDLIWVYRQLKDKLNRYDRNDQV